jgi:hypothetical protein
VTRSASHSVLCLRPITGQTLRTALVEICYPTRCAHVICPHRRGEVVERSPAGTNVRLGSNCDLPAQIDQVRFGPHLGSGGTMPEACIAFDRPKATWFF